jgi:hypothetical protein
VDRFMESEPAPITGVSAGKTVMALSLQHLG